MSDIVAGEIMRVAMRYIDQHTVTGAQMRASVHLDHAVDLRRIGEGAADSDFAFLRID
jgi:hypothetical protein